MSKHKASELLVISSYPPRVCGIATYSQDLIEALTNQFAGSFKVSICALESANERYNYPRQVQHTLNTLDTTAFSELADRINSASYELILVQHEFGFFNTCQQDFLELIQAIEVPVIITFHTVLPRPDALLRNYVQAVCDACSAIIVMTRNASEILRDIYEVPVSKIKVIPHGIHLVQCMNRELLKHKYGFTDKAILSTFGLISSGKGIETTLEALPSIINANPDVLFLVIGKTHPVVVQQEGEKYRDMLMQKVKHLQLEDHVRFINYYLPLPDLLEFLQLTDIYLFTSMDPDQAVSGTFSYAISCGCPIVSTPIPHACEILQSGTGLLTGFGEVTQLSQAVARLLGDESLRQNMRSEGLHCIMPNAWQNTAIAHASIFREYGDNRKTLHYQPPVLKLDHLINLSSNFGLIQFSRINEPDANSGYTLDDNARALVTMCMHYRQTSEPQDLVYISRYLQFMEHCMQPGGNFLNYVNEEREFTSQNDEVNLDDANGRAFWALGYLMSHKDILPQTMLVSAENMIQGSLKHVTGLCSSRAIGFALKGLYYYQLSCPMLDNVVCGGVLANRLERMYLHECDSGWNWFESYLTYGNSILSEGMLCAYLLTKNERFRSIAHESFDFLLGQTFTDTRIKPISNKSWLQKGKTAAAFGEQPIDVAYSILALARFYDEFGDQQYLDRMDIAFSWFLGNNHLQQTIYNSGTGGCYDGLEETHVNFNQGAESTISYLMARLTIEKYNHISYQKNRKRTEFIIV